MGFAERGGSTVAYGGAGSCRICRLFGYTAVHLLPLGTSVVRWRMGSRPTSWMGSVAADAKRSKSAYRTLSRASHHGTVATHARDTRSGCSRPRGVSKVDVQTRAAVNAPEPRLSLVWRIVDLRQPVSDSGLFVERTRKVKAGVRSGCRSRHRERRIRVGRGFRPDQRQDAA